MSLVETLFSALSVKSRSARKASVQNGSASSSKTIDEKIKGGVALLVEREVDGKKIFKCWTCNEYGHYASKCPKREKKYKGRFRSRRPRNYLYDNEEEEEEESNQSRSEDELGFVAIKEDDLDK